MGIKYLWDTNICIYYLQQLFPTNTEKFIDQVILDYMPVISVISEIELLSWNTKNKDDLKILQGFVDDIHVIELDKTIKRETANIRKTYKVKLPDAIIAATAISNQLILITRNDKDFSKINGLKLFNPFKNEK